MQIIENLQVKEKLYMEKLIRKTHIIVEIRETIYRYLKLFIK